MLLLLLRVTRGARNLSEPQFQELKRCRQRTAQLEGQVRWGAETGPATLRDGRVDGVDDHVAPCGARREECGS